MPPVPDYHTGGFVFSKQTYFCKSGMSRNSYAGLCGAEIIFDDQSDCVRSIATQSTTFGDQSFRFHQRFDHAVIDLKDFTAGLITFGE